MKNYDKNKESPYLKYWNENNIFGRELSQNLPVDNFGWIEDTFQFNEDFIKKTIMKNAMNDMFFKLMFKFLKNYKKFIMNE